MNKLLISDSTIECSLEDEQLCLFFWPRIHDYREQSYLAVCFAKEENVTRWRIKGVAKEPLSPYLTWVIDKLEELNLAEIKCLCRCLGDQILNSDLVGLKAGRWLDNVRILRNPIVCVVDALHVLVFLLSFAILTFPDDVKSQRPRFGVSVEYRSDALLIVAPLVWKNLNRFHIASPLLHLTQISNPRLVKWRYRLEVACFIVIVLHHIYFHGAPSWSIWVNLWFIWQVHEVDNQLVHCVDFKALFRTSVARRDSLFRNWVSWNIVISYLDFMITVSVRCLKEAIVAVFDELADFGTFIDRLLPAELKCSKRPFS